jgi:methyl-accepting chemotaxis protein
MKILSHPGLDLQVKRRRKAIPIKTLLFTGFLISGLIPTLVVSYVSYRTTQNQMKEQVFRQLESVRNIKKEQIHNFFNERIANISTFSENPTCIKAYKEFASVFKQAGDEFKGFSREKFTAPDSYLVIHGKYFSFFKNLISHYGYYDLFLLDPIYGDTLFTFQ